MFSLVRHLRRQGYDAKLILTSGFDHFRPEADTFEELNSELVVKMDFINGDILNLDKKIIRDFFLEFNFIIACGFSIAF